MSSPAQDQDSGAAQSAQTSGNMPVSILFCPECSNMLYPKEDKEARRLMYQCRTCQHTEVATSNCVYRNILKSQAGDTAGVTQDVALDPTVGSPTTTTLSDPQPSPTSTLAMCGCCGRIIMCSDCDIRPVFVPVDPASGATTAYSSLSSTPPVSYGAEPATPVSDLLDPETSWSRTLDKLSQLDIRPIYEDEDMTLDNFEEDWEPETEEDIPSQGLGINQTSHSVAT